jgi:hypothetical protein
MSLKYDNGDYENFFGTRPPEEDKYPCVNHHIEKITGDNRRPGMLQEGYLVRYRLHKDFGWTGCATFKTLPEANAFASTLTPDGDLPMTETTKRGNNHE